MKRILILPLLLYCCALFAQNIPIGKQKFIFFPYTPHHKWTTAVGFTATTMPYEITEELHYRIPAIDFHILGRLTKHFSLDTRFSIQGIQNMIAVGPRYIKRLTDRVSVGIGDDAAYWFGFVNVQGFKTTGSGWQNYPNLSLGYRFNKRILFTFRADAILTTSIHTRAGENPVATKFNLFSGSSYSVMLEQPFYGKKSLALGFRAIYTNFFWQTWSAFTSFDRKFFYPQLIVSLIL